MATRRERVILELQDDFSSSMARAAVTTELLDRRLDSLSKRAVITSRSTAVVNRELSQTPVAAKAADKSINQLTGRLAVFRDLAVTLGPALNPVGGVLIAGIGGLANQLGVAALAGGSMIAAFQGVGGALEAVNAARLEPTAKNLAAAATAMEKLSPAAREAVSAMSSLTPVLQSIRDAGAENLFPGFVSALDSLESRAPEVERIVGSLNRAMGDLLADGGASLASSEWDQFFDFLATDARDTLSSLGQSVGLVASGLADMWMAFDPLNDDFSSWALDASRDFSKWADSLSGTKGFIEFVDYVRATGPQVAATFGAMGDALLQIVQATAPLGGPVLSALEAVANVVAGLADSDLATPFFLGAAALAAYNRTLAITAGLQARMGAGGALGMIAGSTGGKGIATARTAMTGMRADLSALAATYTTAGARTAREQARMAASAKSLGRNLGTATKGIAPAGAALAGLAIISSGAADDIGLTNTASLALMGTMAGPWGALGGAVAGAMIDASAGMKDFTQVAEGVDDLLSRLSTTHNVSETDYLAAAAGVETLRQEYADLIDETDSFSLTGAKNTIEGIFGSSDIEEASAKLAAAREGLAELVPVMEEYEAVAAEIATTEAAAAALFAFGEAAVETASSFVGLGDSVSDAEVSLGDWLTQLEAQNRALRDFRVNAVQAARKGLDEGLVASLQAAGPEGALRMAELADGTEREVARANRAWRRGEREVAAYAASVMGLPPGVVTSIATKGIPKTEAAVDRLVKKYNLTEEDRDALLTVSGVSQAIADANRAGTALDAAARDRSATITTRYINDAPIPLPARRNINEADGGVLNFYANGGLRENHVAQFAKAGAWRVWAEEETGGEAYIPLAQSKRARSLDIWQETGRRLGVQGFADGGLSGSKSSPGVSSGPGKEYANFEAALNRLARNLDKAGKGFDGIASRLDQVKSKMDEAGSRSAEQFAAELFAAPSSPWSSYTAGPLGALQQSTSDLRDRKGLQKQLAERGLKGDAYSAAMEGSNDDLRALLSSGQVKQFQREFNTYSRLQSSTASQAGKYAYGKEVNAIREEYLDRKEASKSRKETNRRLERVEKAVRDVGGDVSKGINRSASTAQRNRRRNP